MTADEGPYLIQHTRIMRYDPVLFKGLGLVQNYFPKCRIYTL